MCRGGVGMFCVSFGGEGGQGGWMAKMPPTFTLYFKKRQSQKCSEHMHVAIYLYHTII